MTSRPIPDAVTVRYWAAARAAAGAAEDAVPAGSLADVLAAARTRHPTPRFAEVLGICSLLVDGRPVGHRDHAALPVAPGAVVEVLPPFAGGAGGAREARAAGR